ncbi:beta strand repeat-containing protein, partial [Legionella qingyii]|uniref:beta strand repeat-containing protein n=1 Tax=Legionella qingyii TaxID=2184757 RepID=UPI001F22025E
SGGTALVRNADGSYTVNASQLKGLAITLNDQLASTTKLALAITAYSTVGTSVATAKATQMVTVNPVADAPILGTQAVSGNEGAAIPLNISANLPAGNTTDVLSVKIGNVPDGATLSSGGTALLANTDGTYTLSASQLQGLAITLNDQLASTTKLALAITAYSAVGTSVATAKATQMVTVNPVADAPIIDTQAVSGNEGAAIPLNISAALPAGNTTDVLSVKIGNVPDGATLSSGGTALVANTDGTYTLSASQLQNLAITVNDQLASTTNLALAITAYSAVGTSVATATATQTVTVNPVADVPILGAQAVSGDANTAIALDINAALPVGNTTDSLSVTIDNVPDGAILSSGGTALVANTDGTYTLSASQLQDLAIMVSGDLTVSTNLELAIKAYSTVEDSVATATTTQLVTIKPVTTIDSGSLASANDGTTATGTGGSTTIGTDGSTTIGTGGSTLIFTAGQTMALTDGETIALADGSNMKVTVSGGSMTVTTADGSTITVTSGSTITVTGGSTVTFAGDSSLTFAGDSSLTLAGASTVPVVDGSTALLNGTTAVLDSSTTTVVDGSTALLNGTTAVLDSSTTTVVDGSTALLDGTTAVLDSSTTTALDGSLAYAGGESGPGVVSLDRIVETVGDTNYAYATDPALQGALTGSSLDSAALVPTIDLTPQDSILDVSAQSVLSVAAADSSSTITTIDSSTMTVADSLTVTAVDSSTAIVDSSTAIVDSSTATVDSSTAIISGQTDATLSLQGTYTDIGIGGVELNQTLI